MVARNVGRFVAPIALIAVIVATVLVVSSGLSTSTATHHAAAGRHSVRTVLTVHAPTRKVFYVVQAGDSLSTISVRTGIPVATLETLNPAIDPNALQTGQRLRLRH
ncbi:MAG TPA: LysM peptidoglycan-binding domain-containing protein [Solirubrobacteraceae bacterium]|nr:LysM peptidoglycan-binding domain-containing protein [Solirubrobacteraceae bacterium]